MAVEVRRERPNRLTVDFKADQIAEIRELAAAQRISANALIRQLVDDALPAAKQAVFRRLAERQRTSVA